ncbi:MAG: TolC family protein [Candidatus Cloacimonadota bacterium]|nr:TolC family protein [Candidatus Cloacimonadota bacterium]
MKKIFLILLILPAICLAQGYTLQQMVEIGLENSHEIMSQTQEYKNAKSSLRANYWEILPSANLNASKNKHDDQAWLKNSGFSLSKSIYLDEPTYFNIRRGILNKENAELTMEEIRKQIAYNVISYYLSILENKKALEIQQKNLELQEKINQQIQTLYDLGKKSELELQQGEIDFIDYQIAVLEAENRLKTNRKELFNYLNVEDDDKQLLEPELPEYSQSSDFETNLELQRRKNSIKSSEISLFEQKLNFLPSFSLGGSYNYDKNTNADFTEWDKYDDSTTLSLSFSYSLFDLFHKYESHGQLKRNLKIQEINYDRLEKEYQKELENLNSNIATLKRAKQLYKKKVELSEKNLSMAEEQFRLGLISLLDLDRSKLDYQNAQLNYNNKYYELFRKQEELNLLLSNKILGKW